MFRLKELRKKRNVTQQEVADMLSITRAAYSNIENVKRDPDTKTLVRLAQYFNVTTDYLLGCTDHPSAAPQPTVSPQDLDKLEKIKNLPAKDRKIIDTIIEVNNSVNEQATASAK